MGTSSCRNLAGNEMQRCRFMNTYQAYSKRIVFAQGFTSVMLKNLQLNIYLWVGSELGLLLTGKGDMLWRFSKTSSLAAVNS